MVSCTDMSKERRDKAEEFGATAVAPDQVGTGIYDVVIEACGVGKVVRTGISVLKPGQ